MLFQNLQFNEQFPWEDNIIKPFIPTFEDFKKGSHLGWRLSSSKKSRKKEKKSIKKQKKEEKVESLEVNKNPGAPSGFFAQSLDYDERNDNEEKQTSLCFCCDDTPFLTEDLLKRRRKKRTVKIGMRTSLNHVDRKMGGVPENS